MGSWKNCEGSDCDYHVSWHYDEEAEEITFTMTVRQEQTKWAGLGFKTDRNMVIDEILEALSRKLSNFCSTDKIARIIVLDYLNA